MGKQLKPKNQKKTIGKKKGGQTREGKKKRRANKSGGVMVEGEKPVDSKRKKRPIPKVESRPPLKKENSMKRRTLVWVHAKEKLPSGDQPKKLTKK